MKHIKSFIAPLVISLSMIITGCATLKDAYNSTTDTVKNWVSTDTKKSDEKKPEVKPAPKSEDKKSTDTQLDEPKSR